MGSGVRPVVLVIDDEPDVRSSLKRTLERVGYDVRLAEGGDAALALLGDVQPNVVLLDVNMPGGPDGFEVCRRILIRDSMQMVPIIFVTGRNTDQDQAAAFAGGGAAFLSKPFEMEDLHAVVAEHLQIGRRWKGLVGPPAEWSDWQAPVSFDDFKASLAEELKLSQEQVASIAEFSSNELYDICGTLSIPEEQLARSASRFLNLPYAPKVDPDDVALGALPRTFCETNMVAPVFLRAREVGVVLANPFSWELLDTLDRTFWRGRRPEVAVTTPRIVRRFFETDVLRRNAPKLEDVAMNRGDDGTAKRASDLLASALERHASDLIITPEGDGLAVRLIIDGEMHLIGSLDPDQGPQLSAYFKGVTNTDETKPPEEQAGSVEITVDDTRLKLSLTVARTSEGETLRIRLFQPMRPVRRLERLGMAKAQIDQLEAMVGQTRGMILVIGPPGSGKSTTLFSALSRTGEASRSVVSVERMIEHRIAFTNQLEINERAGATFDSLLLTVRRHAPDIFFLGEIDDPASAKAAVDYATSRGLVIGTMDAPNVPAALARLERLGVERLEITESMLGMVSQRLVRRLCRDCRQSRDISAEERTQLSATSVDPPATVWEAPGCDECGNGGYRGREGVYEVIPFDAGLSELVAEDAEISKLRRYRKSRQDFTMSHHALEKVREGLLSATDAYEAVLSDEAQRQEVEATEAESDPEAYALVVDDDLVTQRMVRSILESAGYVVATAGDGVEALNELSQSTFDVVVSDMNMPNVDGLKLLELMALNGFDIPFLLLTVETDEGVEQMARRAGAADFIRKPISSTELVQRVGVALEGRQGATVNSVA